ncbi:MAG: hypothetical protein ACK58T_06560 [Phycisphaerae bacterium]|jgi:hypothetical protein
MQTRLVLLAGGTCALSVASLSLGAVTYLTQDRSITAATSFDGSLQTITAPDFNPFVQTINLSTNFPALNNTIGLNEAVAGIDCHLDPNNIKASGRLLARGGMTADGNTVAAGSAQATVRTTFRVDSASAFKSSPRPAPWPERKTNSN